MQAPGRRSCSEVQKGEGAPVPVARGAGAKDGGGRAPGTAGDQGVRQCGWREAQRGDCKEMTTQEMGGRYGLRAARDKTKGTEVVGLSRRSL